MIRTTQKIPFIDIAANLIDSMYCGVYNEKEKHEPDLDHVLKRCWDIGIEKVIITGCNLSDSKKAVELAQRNERLFSTVGCHPTNCNEFEKTGTPDDYLLSLVDLCKSNPKKVVAAGEFGLDYDRLNFCSKDIQKKYFREQLLAFEPLNLPLFLHCRNAAEDLLKILYACRDGVRSGVVHSFDGSLQEAFDFIDLGLCIGINGCSLKTEENLEVMKQLPNNKIIIETDCPWCEIRPTHAGYKYIKTKFPSSKKEKWDPNKLVKGRNEPVNILQVLEVMASVRNEDIKELGNIIYGNTQDIFFQFNRQE